jgi:type II secretory pathway pseudopilin PulG
MNKINFKNGFTLLEALVAISILMVAVVAPITIAQKGLSSATYSKSQMIASYLAQDAIEYIINKRDENVIAKRDWLDVLSTFCVGVDVVCEVDTIANAGVGATGPGDGILFKTTNGFYGFSGLNVTNAEMTNFVRKINIEETDPNVSALITVTVNWGGDDNKVIVKTLIYNI